MPAPRTPALQRALALISQGWSVPKASAEAGIQRSAVYAYLRRQSRTTCPHCAGTGYVSDDSPAR